MYVPKHFAAPGPEAVHRLLAEAGASDLITHGPGGFEATTVPLIFDPAVGGHGALLGHLARGNQQWQDADGAEALVVARGPDAYVSPSWYAVKQEHGRVVPTWNYTVVHAHGRLLVHDDPAWCEQLVRRLTDRHEAGRAQPWSVDDAPPRYVAGRLRGIVGIEVRITRLEAKFKLSQNRVAADRAGVADGLAAGDERQRAVAEAVRTAERSD
jgi:transcriptional regulator